MAGHKFPKIGLALGSGGAKGLAHIGVLKVLQSHNIPIDYIAGSSIGAFIGGYYAAHPDLAKLEDLIFSINKRKGFLLFDPTFRGGIIKGDRIEKFIEETLEDANFSSLRIPFVAVATDFYSAEKVIIQNGDLIKAIRASISVPAVFQPVSYDNRILVDGGLSEPVPVQVAKSMGSDIVIGVNVESTDFSDPIDKIPLLSQIPMHSVNILRHNLTFQSLETADIIIAPKIPSIGLIGWNYFFDTEKAQTIIKAGEKAAKHILPDLLYLISKKQNEKSFKSRFFSFFQNFKS
jgi:NTE family protein